MASSGTPENRTLHTDPGREAARRLEALRPRFEALNAERIRADSEAERLEREGDAARAAARLAFGTDDPRAIAAMLEADARHEAEAVAALEAALAAVEGRLAKAEDAA